MRIAIATIVAALLSFTAGSAASAVPWMVELTLKGQEIEGTLRHIWEAQGDKIVRLEEFHDIERLRAFFALLATADAKQ